MVKILNKSRSDIEDKFCKFEIKKLIEGDETVSIISDTWSTDVLASDSETIDANDRNFATPLIPSNVILPGDQSYDPLGVQFPSNNLDETQSESAWSTDVLASDSEKLNEVDADDNNQHLKKNMVFDLCDSKSELLNSLIPGSNSTNDQPSNSIYTKHDILLNGEAVDHNLSIQNDQPITAPLASSGYNIMDDILEMSSNVINEEIIKSDSNITNPFFDVDDDCVSDFAVEHRRNAASQRNANYDSRRNGISNTTVTESESIVHKTPPIDLIEAKQNTKPNRSTGAIPKSISFDASADKNNHNSPTKRGSILNKIKGFANIKNRRNRFSIDQVNDTQNNGLTIQPSDKVLVAETTDDILGKYRRKVSTSSDPATSSDSAGSNSSSKL